MSAKEMFKKLGYELINEVPLLYQKDDGGYIQNIEFISTLKTIKFSEYETYNNNEPQGETILYLEELQAINKQIEELGWNNERNII